VRHFSPLILRRRGVRVVKKLHGWSMVGAIITALAALTMAPTQGVAAGSTQGSPGSSWQYNPSPDALSNGVTILVHGYRQGSGCATPISDTLQPGGPEIEHQILAVQPTTCAMVIQQGTPSAKPTPHPSGFSTERTSNSISLPPGTGGADPSAEAWIHGWYVDPIGLDVNGVVDYVVWSYNGSCVTSAGAGANLGLDGGTGWYVQGNSWTDGASCSYVYSQSDTTFGNGGFCLGQATHTYYNPFWIHGNYNGSATVRGYLSDSGPCGRILFPDITDNFGSPPSP
jgi:hypothetical protein